MFYGKRLMRGKESCFMGKKTDAGKSERSLLGKRRVCRIRRRMAEGERMQ